MTGAKTHSSTVLVVDDDAMVRSLTIRVLENAGYRVFEAHDGLEAWILLGSLKQRIDLVVSDIVMPRLDGLELMNCIETIPNPPPIILMSGYGPSVVDLERPVLTKPFRPDELLAAVEHLLAQEGG